MRIFVKTMNKICDKTTWGRWGVVALFGVLCLLYFSPIAAPHKLVYPLLLLTISSMPSRKPTLTLALAFSALGDLCGSLGALLPQIGAFGVAQVCYILLFCKIVRSRTPKLWPTLGALVVPLTLCTIAFVGIIPQVASQTLQTAVVVYALVVGSMAFCAGLSGKWLVWLGATLFMVSDFLLASALFVAPLSHYIYLPPYFAGQLLLWLGLQNKYLAHQ